MFGLQASSEFGPRFRVGWDWFGPRVWVFDTGCPGSDGCFFLTRLLHNFPALFSLLPAAFPLPISIPFLPFPLCLSSLFSSSKFCGLKIPKTIDLRTFRKTQFFDLDYRQRRLQKGIKHTLSYYAIVRDPSCDGNWAFDIGFRVVWDSSGKLETRPTLFEIFLSLVFSFFSLFTGILRCSESLGLKAERGAVLISRGIREIRQLSENSPVFRWLIFFFPFFLFLFP